MWAEGFLPSDSDLEKAGGKASAEGSDASDASPRAPAAAGAGAASHAEGLAAALGAHCAVVKGLNNIGARAMLDAAKPAGARWVAALQHKRWQPQEWVVWHERCVVDGAPACHRRTVVHPPSAPPCPAAPRRLSTTLASDSAPALAVVAGFLFQLGIDSRTVPCLRYARQMEEVRCRRGPLPAGGMQPALPAGGDSLRGALCPAGAMHATVERSPACPPAAARRLPPPTCRRRTSA